MDSAISSATRVPRDRRIFWFFVLCYSLVHLNFEYTFWFTDGWGIFGKYAEAATEADRLLIAQRVYFTKATWMIVLIWLQCLRVPFATALAYSFLLYSVELLLFFPFRSYSVLNLLLAGAMVIEDWRSRREA
jgi:hypothetical protein